MPQRAENCVENWILHLRLFFYQTLTKPVIPSAFHRRVDDPEDESTVRRRKLLEKVASEASTASAGTTDSFTSEFGVLPAILVAIASAMLACSALLFFYFLRDRRCFEKLLLRHCENTTGTSEKQNVKGEGSGASDSHTGTERTEGSALTEKSSSSKQNETGGQEVFDVFPSKVPSSKHCWGGSREAPEIIFIHSSAPPAMVEKSEDKIEDAMHGTTRTQSLQPTLTVSESDGIFEDRLLLSSKPVRSGSDYYYERNPTTFKMTTTLLLGKDRVNDYSDLGSLILNLTTTRIASTSTRCGSSKGGSNSSGTKLRATPYSDYETQCGEVFVNSCYEDMIHISASSNAPKLEARDDQTYNLRGTAVDNDIRMDIERYAFNPYDNTATSELLIRDIYCTPAAIWGQGTMKFADFGLELKNSLCPHPFIVAVNKCSPLSGRTCNGDVLISVNDMDTAGLSPKDVFDLVPLTASGAIKFTVLRTFETDSEDCESLHGPSCRVDLGLVEPAVDI